MSRLSEAPSAVGREVAPAARIVEPGEAAVVAEALTPLLPAAVAPLFDASFVRSCVLFDEFVLRLALEVFRAAGLGAAASEWRSASEIAARAGLDPGRAVVPVDWILRRLAASGLVEATVAARPRFRVGHPLSVLDPAPVREAQRAYDPSWLPSYTLAETVAKDYEVFLRGQAAGERILFSPARFNLWFDYFSNDNGLYAINNRVGAMAVEAWMPAGHGAILELGGGLASATTALLDRLKGSGRLDEVHEYRFTELVPAFLRRGQRALQGRFADAPFLTFAQLDMNHPFAEQAVAPGSLRVVYAVNTLHVAYDLAFSLGEVRRALAPGGVLVLSECVRPRAGQAIHVEFVFNLMETFRAPRLHPVYRPNGGFLTPEQWTAALKAAGFTDVRFLPDIISLRERFPAFCVAAIGAVRPAA